MFGAIIGDLAGSIYEYAQTKQIQRIIPRELVDDKAFFSDDTILTMAIVDAAITDKDYAGKLKEYALRYMDYKPQVEEYFKSTFSPGFTRWAKSDSEGNSTGNGAMMRVSPIGYLFDNERDVITNAYYATVPSHNSIESIECATKVALTIFLARQGYTKDEIYSKLDISLSKPHLTKFNTTCIESMDVCFYSLYFGQSFEDCLRLALSFGGDTDTNCAIVGSMAEAFYEIDKDLQYKALSKIPQEFVSLLSRAKEMKMDGETKFI